MVDVKVTSTDKMNDAFKEKDEKYREWTIRETREKKVSKAVMVHLIISHDGAVHKDTIRRWKDFAPDIQVDWCGWHRTSCTTTSSLLGSFSIRGSWMSEAWRKVHHDEFADEPDGPPERIPTPEERRGQLCKSLIRRALHVCGLRARHLHTAFG